LYLLKPHHHAVLSF